MISMEAFFCLLIVSYFSINDDNRMNFYAKLQYNYVDMQKKKYYLGNILKIFRNSQ